MRGPSGLRGPTNDPARARADAEGCGVVAIGIVPLSADAVPERWGALLRWRDDEGDAIGDAASDHDHPGSRRNVAARASQN
jgi:hypothetical protein